MEFQKLHSSYCMRVCILTNSKLSVPAIDFLAAGKLLVAVGLPERQDRTEDAEQVQYTAVHYQVPVQTFSSAALAATLSEWLELTKPDVVLVFTFPFKIPTPILSIPPKGFINFHFGILPQYRGADAIFWQIRNGEKEGGISVHQMTSQLDKGSLYMIQKIPISPNDTYGSHLLNLSMAAIEVVEKLLQMLQAENPASTVQDESKAAYFHRPAFNDLLIDWSKPAADIIALINAANPWNKGAITYLGQYPLKIIAASFRADQKNIDAAIKPGTITVVDERNGCYVCCGSGEILNLDILYCNDSFITGIQFAKLGISPGIRFEKPAQTHVV